MIFKKKKTLSMDFDTRSIKIVEASFEKGKINVSEALCVSLPKGAYENGYIIDFQILKDVLGSFLRLNNVKRGATTIVINSTDILTREIILPNVPKDEIAGIIRYKINDYIPIDIEDYIIQYIDQGTFIEDGNEKKMVFIIAMPKEIVVSFLDLLRYLDLKPKKLDFKSNSMRKFLKYHSLNKTNYNIENNTVAIVDIEFTNTNLSIFKDMKIELSRTLPIGIKNMLEIIDTDLQEQLLEEISNLEYEVKLSPEIEVSLNKLLDDLCEKLDMVFRYYNSSELGNSIELIFIQGDIVKFKIVQEMFEEHLKIETLSINSFDKISNDKLHIYSNALGSILNGVEL